MKRLNFALGTSVAALIGLANAGATIYQQSYVANGTFCVDQNARDIFNALNDLRVNGVSSVYYTKFKTACDEVAANSKWTNSSGNQVTVSNVANAAAALSFVQSAAKVSTPLSWSAGLAAAGQTLFNSWTQSGSQSLTDGNGGTTVTRAQTYGSLGTSSLAEYAAYVETSFWSVQDAVNTLLISDGDPNGVVRTNLFDAKNTVASALNGFATIGGTNTYMIEFQTAKSFTDAASVNTACTITQNFGGTLCDQTGKAKDFYNAINSMRSNPNVNTNELFGARIKQWQSGFQTSSGGGVSQIPMTLTDANGIQTTINTTDGKPGVDNAITALNAVYTGGTVLKPLAWSPPLQMAGTDWINQIVGQTSIVTSVNGSTTASRASKYGDIGAGGQDIYQGIIGLYQFDALDAAIYLVVDDGKSSQNYPNRNAILSTSYTQIAVHYAASTALSQTNIYSANFADSKYVAKSDVSCTSSGLQIAMVQPTTVFVPGAPSYPNGATVITHLSTVSALAVLVQALF